MTKTNKYIAILQNILKNSRYGNLELTLPDGQHLRFAQSAAAESYVSELNCRANIKEWRLFPMLLQRGDVGLGEAYHLGLWESENLTDFLTYCSLNLADVGKISNPSWFNRILFFIHSNYLRLNNRYGSKRNIIAHYDLGNDFYRLWLDSSMTYSSGLRLQASDDLATAQQNKYRRIIEALNIKSGAKVLEIGCGWGGFSELAALSGADITGVTISDAQYDFAQKRLGQAAQILNCDYRDIEGQFDHIVSIEMFEAVGERYWSTYFAKLRSLLKPGGTAMLQIITLRDDLFALYRRNVDYIRMYVFPGGMLPTMGILENLVQRHSLKLVDSFAFGQDYAWTLGQWLQNFNAQSENILSLGYDATFMRAWSYYLSLCSAGFNAGRTDVVQLKIQG